MNIFMNETENIPIETQLNVTKCHFLCIEKDRAAIDLRTFNIYVSHEIFGKTHVRKRPPNYHDVRKKI